MPGDTHYLIVAVENYHDPKELALDACGLPVRHRHGFTNYSKNEDESDLPF